MITIEHNSGDPLKTKAEILFALTVEGEEPEERCAKTFTAVKKAVTSGDFTGKAKQLRVFYPDSEKAPKRLALVGAGPRGKLSVEQVRRAVAKIMDAALGLKVRNIAVTFEQLKLDTGEAATAAAIAESLTLASYVFSKYKTKANPDHQGFRVFKDEKRELSVTIFCQDKAAEKAVSDAYKIAIATNHIRELADEPGNVANPTYVAEFAKKLSKKYGFACKVLEEADMRKEGMGALLGVSQGSLEPAKLIIMEHQPKAFEETICLVGKGVTFDSGGLSIKPVDKMWEMKYDMCGAAAVIGAMCAISALGLPIHVYGIVPASENLPDGAAIKPGDILTSMTGHTIEVLNTDAEGRLILADALGYCHRLNPDIVVDFATLTGACVTSLASIRAGAMGDDGICQKLMAAGDATGERCWQLPLDEEYGEMLKSNHADLKNIGGSDGAAGTITAGYFLSHFVPPHAKWAHLDIAGTAWKTDSSDKKTYIRKGASGFGVRLITKFLLDRC